MIDIDEATRFPSKSEEMLPLSQRSTIVTTRPLGHGQFGGKRKKRRGSRKGGNLLSTTKLTLDQANLELNNIIQDWNNNVNNSPEQMLTALIDFIKEQKRYNNVNLMMMTVEVVVLKKTHILKISKGILLHPYF